MNSARVSWRNAQNYILDAMANIVDLIFEFSDQQLKEAYSRMDMPAQPWTRGTEQEIGFLKNE